MDGKALAMALAALVIGSPAASRADPPPPWEGAAPAMGVPSPGKPPGDPVAREAPGLAQPAPATPDDGEGPMPPDANNPSVARLLPDTIRRPPEGPGGWGTTMQTARTYGSNVETCIVSATDAECEIRGAALGDGEQGHQAVVSWNYQHDHAGKAIVLFTVSGHQDQRMGLQVVYGGDPKDGLIGSGDFVGAIGTGAKVARTTFLGCRDSCIYGIVVDEQPGMADWLVKGDALGLRFNQGHRVHEVPGTLAGFAGAEAAAAVDSTRRLDPGAKGDVAKARAARTAPTDAPAGMVPPG